MLSQKEFVELYVNADEETRNTIDEMILGAQPEQKKRRYPRDIDKIMDEYETKYSRKSNIYATELDELMSRSKDKFDLVVNCIRFGYVVGRRAEKRARYTRKK